MIRSEKPGSKPRRIQQRLRSNLKNHHLNRISSLKNPLQVEKETTLNYGGLIQTQ